MHLVSKLYKHVIDIKYYSMNVCFSIFSLEGRKLKLFNIAPKGKLNQGICPVDLVLKLKY